MVQPIYPPEARAAHLEGDVILDLTLAKDGSVYKINNLRGNPALAESARQAVAKWRYQPYLLNGIPVVVETEVTVKFRLTLKKQSAVVSKSPN